MNGDFSNALENIDLKYRPSNHSNEVFKKLIKSGFRPVYVKLKNNTGSPRQITLSQFQLCNDQYCFEAIPQQQVPKHIREIYPEAYLANTWNITVAVVIAVAIVLVFSRAGGSAFNLPSISNGSSQRGSGTGGLNDTEKITHIKYKDLLLSDMTLAPDQEREGVLFFALGSHNDEKLSLVLKSQNED